MAVETEANIARIEEFKVALSEWRKSGDPQVREWLSQRMPGIRRITIEIKTFSHVVIAAPPILRQPPITVDPFEMMFEVVYNRSLIPSLIDMLNKSIGILREPPLEAPADASVKTEVQTGYAFIAMPMDDEDNQLIDVLETIKSAADQCGIVAERIDDDQKNERITGRVLENIRKAEFLIADLTKERPSVYYEAGYAERDGKAPIFVARRGTAIHFDVKDFPIIFFSNMKELREGLTARLRAILAARADT